MRRNRDAAVKLPRSAASTNVSRCGRDSAVISLVDKQRIFSSAQNKSGQVSENLTHKSQESRKIGLELCEAAYDIRLPPLDCKNSRQLRSRERIPLNCVRVKESPSNAFACQWFVRCPFRSV